MPLDGVEDTLPLAEPLAVPLTDELDGVDVVAEVSGVVPDVEALLDEGEVVDGVVTLVDVDGVAVVLRSVVVLVEVLLAGRSHPVVNAAASARAAVRETSFMVTPSMVG